MRQIFIILFICCLPLGLIAQKGKKSSDSKAQREAEFYFTEGQKYYILEDYAKALVMFEKARSIEKDNAAIYYKMAQVYEHNEKLSQASENIQQAIKLDKNNKYFYLLAADIETKLGNFNKAARYYEDMLDEVENTGNYLLELAAIYLYKDDLDKAYNTYERAEDYFGINEEIISQKQKILLEQGDIEGAVREAQKLVDYSPDNQYNVVALAELMVENNQKEEALNILITHLEEYPENVLVNMFIGNIYIKDQQLTLAKPYLLEAFSSNLIDVNAKVQILASFRADLASAEKKDLALLLADALVRAHDQIADAHSVYGDILFSTGDKENALEQYMKAIDLDASSFTLWQNVLQLYLEEENFDSVLALSDNALELFPNQNAIYYYRGLAHLKQSNYEEAIFDLKQGKMLSISDPKLVSAFNGMLGEAYHGLGQFGKSDEAYEAALDYDPDNPLVLNSYSYNLALRGEKLEKAEEMAGRLVEEFPGVASYVDTYAWVLYQKKDYQRAYDLMKTVIQSTETKAMYHDHYGDILYRLGMVEEAVTQWELARDKDPTITNINKKITEKKIYE